MELNKPIRMSEEVLIKLRKMKIHPRQSYNEIILELIKLKQGEKKK